MTSKLTRTFAAGAFAAVALAGCGGPANEADAIAQDACDLIGELVALDDQMAAGDMDAMADLESAFERIAALEQRADDAGISDAEMEAAMEQTCPEFVDGF